MPMIWTHILFSGKVIDRTEKIVNFTLDKNYLILVTQGDNMLKFALFGQKIYLLLIRRPKNSLLKIVKKVLLNSLNQLPKQIKKSLHILLVILLIVF